jgi:hypothetical protein
MCRTVCAPHPNITGAAVGNISYYVPVLPFLGYGYSHSVLLRLRTASDKNYRENPNTNLMLNNFSFPKNQVVYKIMSKKC